MTDEEKWTFLEHVPALDAKDPKIKRLAEELNDAAQGNPQRFAQLAHTIARDWIHQVSDVTRTGGEDIAGLTRPPTLSDATDALERGEDDCDAKARLFVALCLAAGLAARMAPRWQPTSKTEATPLGRTLTHVSAEVHLNGAWRPVELTLARARLGELGENVPKENATGHWMMP